MKYTIALLALAAVLTQTGCNQAVAQDKSAPAAREVELMVYADDFAMIQETRQVELARGRSKLGLTDISKSLDQESVIFSWPKNKENEVISSTYDLGTQENGSLLSRFLGKPVDLVFRGQNGRESERLSGILEVADPGNIVVRVGDRYLVNPEAEIQAPANAGIVTIPQLTAEVDAKSGGQTTMGVGYLTRGMGWQADYTLRLPREGDQLDLECWATVTNQTGVDFPDAKLKFVAGSPNRAVRNSRYRYGGGGMPAMSEQSANDKDVSGFVSLEPQSVGELHAYPYEAKATIKQEQKNRVRMMNTDSIPVKRDYSIALPDYWGWSANPTARLNATVAIKFANDKASGLGAALPGGAVRVYEPGENGSMAYIGAATLQDTPTDAKIDLTLSNVFDIYAQARRVSEKKLDKRSVRTTYEVVAHNEKSRHATVRLVQPIYGSWKIATETVKSRKLNASQVEWTIEIPAGGEKKLLVAVDRKF